MSFEYSEGKKKVQKHAGVEYEAQRLTGMVKNYVASHGQQFIQNQTFLIISSVDENGALWTSIIKGNQKGFVHFLSPEKVEIDIKHIDFNPNDNSFVACRVQFFAPIIACGCPSIGMNSIVGSDCIPIALASSFC